MRPGEAEIGAGPRTRASIAASIGLASALAIAALALLTGSASSEATTELLPDLTVERPAEIQITKSKRGERVRLSHTVANVGPGPLEIYPGDSDDDCDSDGKGTEERFAFQRIYLDSDPGDGEFHRVNVEGHPADTSSNSEAAGCMRYHPQHTHWHFDAFARYSLYRERTGSLVGEASKVSFCVLDSSHLYPSLPGSPNGVYYPHIEAGQPTLTCNAEATEGLSVGWADTYTANLQGQAINLNDSRGGHFCLALSADPEDQLVESNELNNNRVLRVGINLERMRLHRLPGACKTPDPLPLP